MGPKFLFSHPNFLLTTTVPAVKLLQAQIQTKAALIYFLVEFTLRMIDQIAKSRLDD